MVKNLHGLPQRSRLRPVYFFYCELYLTATEIHLSSHKVVVKPVRDTLSLFLCARACVDNRRSRLPRELLDGHKHKDTLINSLNVCKGEHPPSAPMHSREHGTQESCDLSRARGRVLPGSPGKRPGPNSLLARCYAG